MSSRTPDRAPYARFTPEQAHREMQRHRACTVEGCERKAAAFYALVAAGRATPDTSRGSDELGAPVGSWPKALAPRSFDRWPTMLLGYGSTVKGRDAVGATP